MVDLGQRKVDLKTTHLFLLPKIQLKIIKKATQWAAFI